MAASNKPLTIATRDAAGNMLRRVESDETYVGRKVQNRHASQHDGKRGIEGTYAVVGIVDRATGQISTEAINDTKKDELQGYLEEYVMSDSTGYSDPARLRRPPTTARSRAAWHP